MAFLTIQELESKYGVTREQKVRLQNAVAHDKIRYQVAEEPASKITGHHFPLSDTKVSVLKYDEEDAVRLLKED